MLLNITFKDGDNGATKTICLAIHIYQFYSIGINQYDNEYPNLLSRVTEVILTF